MFRKKDRVFAWYNEKKESKMDLLLEAIMTRGTVRPDNVLSVPFLNHSIDTKLLCAMGAEWKRLFEDDGITKILTVEASGIALAFATALAMDLNFVFAKKTSSRNLGKDVYETRVFSYTRGAEYRMTIAKDALMPADRVLLIDDFLAMGSALEALRNLVGQTGATVVGAGIAVEKTFQPGGQRLRAQGLRIESLARIKSIHPLEIES